MLVASPKDLSVGLQQDFNVQGNFAPADYRWLIKTNYADHAVCFSARSTSVRQRSACSRSKLRDPRSWF